MSQNRISPWGLTPVEGKYRGILVKKDIPETEADITIVLDVRFEHSPDLLAQHYYGHSKYWYAIPTRNKLEDPIFDLKAGMTLIIPPQYLVTNG